MERTTVTTATIPSGMAATARLIESMNTSKDARRKYRRFLRCQSEYEGANAQYAMLRIRLSSASFFLQRCFFIVIAQQQVRDFAHFSAHAGCGNNADAPPMHNIGSM